MDFLNRSECSAWLKGQNLPDSPYGKPLPSSTNYLQFAVPKYHGASQQLVEGINAFTQKPRDCLFQVTDWSRVELHLEDPILSSLERTCSGELPQFDAVGVLLSAGETDGMLGCCKAVLDSGMSAYIYIPEAATFYLWEGDLIDFWTDDSRQLEALDAWLKRQKIIVTARHAG